MAIRKLRFEEDPILRKISKEVTVFDEKLITLLDDMKETLATEDGVGLACVQVGILKRIFIADFGDDCITECINPVIIEKSGEQVGSEGCLSIPDKSGYCNRPTYVKLRYFDRFGNEMEAILEDFNAVICMHEYDHLDGILYIDNLVDAPEGEETDDYEDEN